MSKKPIAKVLVLAGPTHHGVRLPCGPTTFVPGDSVLLYTPEDLAAAQRLLPASQCKVRVFPRIEDIPAPAPVPEPEPVVEKKEKRAR